MHLRPPTVAWAAVHSKVVVLLLLILFFNVLPIVCGRTVFLFVLLVMHDCVSIIVCNHLEEEEKAGCFANIVLQMYCYYKCSVAPPHCVVGGQQCVIEVFPDHTHLLFAAR